jgi:hypothetical protein
LAGTAASDRPGTPLVLGSSIRSVTAAALSPSQVTSGRRAVLDHGLLMDPPASDTVGDETDLVGIR